MIKEIQIDVRRSDTGMVLVAIDCDAFAMTQHHARVLAHAILKAIGDTPPQPAAHPEVMAAHPEVMAARERVAAHPEVMAARERVATAFQELQRRRTATNRCKLPASILIARQAENRAEDAYRKAAAERDAVVARLRGEGSEGRDPDADTSDR